MSKPFQRAVTTAVLLFCVHIMANFAYAGYQNAGMWVVRYQLKSRQNIDSVIDFARDNGITDIFVQVIGRGRAYYKTSLLPKSPRIKKIKYDPLAYFCEQASRENIKVHAWINTMLVWSKHQKPYENDHPVNKLQDWFTFDNLNKSILSERQKTLKNKGIEGRFLSPAAIKVRQLYQKIVQELIDNYPINGIHLDYIRFPSPNYGYHPFVREKFRSMTGIDPLYIDNSDLLEEFTDIQETKQKWKDFRCNQIDSLIGNLAKITKKYQHIQLSAAVKPDPVEARNKYFQDWEEWLRKGLIDFVVAMNYTSDNQEFGRIVKHIKKRQIKDKVWMGIGTYNQNPVMTDRQFNLCIQDNYKGVVFFSYKSLIDKNLYVKKYGLD
ncbi:MAG: family 10 glycosylhydrolase [Candidatus Marinimicrobia bacterium]|nr:family 10 glycosylhydrolase [Candidatus Neomarinimicrobiota bacterium]